MSASETVRHTRGQRRLVLALHAVYAVLMAVVCGMSVSNAVGDERERISSELIVVADLTSDSMATWYSERMRTAQVVRHRADCATLAMALHENPSDAAARAQMGVLLTTLRDAYEYEAAMLLDGEGVPIISTSVTETADWSESLASAIELGGDVQFVDIHAHVGESGMGTTHMTWVSEISELSIDNEPYFIALTMSPETFLDPLLAETPSRWRTAQLAAFSVEDGDAVILAGSQAGVPLPRFTRRSLDSAQIRARIVEESAEGHAVPIVVQGLDCRGIPVLAAGSAVPGTPWFLYARIDQSELERSLRTVAWSPIALALMLVFFPLLVIVRTFASWTREDMRESYGRELEAANLELEAANAARTNFIASMSHELRTPLNSIIGFSRILLEGMPGEVNDEQRKQLEMVNSAGVHLLSLINDVLDLSKIGAGAETLVLEPVDVRELAESVVLTLQPQAQDKGLFLEWLPPEEDATLHTDRRRAYQVLLNLVGNAVKFTDQGGVTVSMAVGDREIAIVVSDSGIGIGESDLTRIFDDFYQVIDGARAKPSGTGLGLALSRRIAQSLGGDISAESTPGEGSVFTLVLPVEPAEESDALSSDDPIGPAITSLPEPPS